jgi:hypothetical protein
MLGPTRFSAVSLELKEILQLREDRSVGSEEISPEQQFVTHLFEQFLLAIPIIVAKKEHRPSIESVGSQDIEPHRILEGIEVGDVP